MSMFCNYCHKPNCGGKCRPAEYGCMFDLQVDPYDPSKWLVTLNGMLHRVNAPKLNETDTALATNYSTATLNYTSERHVDKVTGRQLGEIINLDDLRDVVVDDTLDGTCYELIYHKWNNCGDGCKSAADEWRNFNINSDGARNDHIRYVRGANVNGCPQYLEVPVREGEYWFGMWDTNGFTYVQAVEDELPTDDEGNPIVMSIDPTTKKPILGKIELPDVECMVQNIINNMKPFTGQGRMIDVQGGGSTAGFTGSLDPYSGDFYIQWDDHYLAAGVPDPVGTGRVSGHITATSSIDAKTGAVTYTITKVDYNTLTYTPHYSGSVPLTMTHSVWGAFPGTYDLGAAHSTLTNEGLLLETMGFWGGTQSSVSVNINKSFSGNYSITVPANGGTSGWISIMRLYNDWDIADDDGIVQVQYTNPLNWSQC